MFKQRSLKEHVGYLVDDEFTTDPFTLSFQINRRDTNPPELQINKVADKIRQFKINQGSIVQLIKITRK